MFGNCSNIEGILPDLVISSWLWSWEGTGQPPLELLVLQIPGIWCWMGSVRDTSPGLQREQVESTLRSDSHWLEGWGSLSHGTLGNHLGASHPSPPNCSATSRPAGAGRASVRAALTECQGRRSRPALAAPSQGGAWRWMEPRECSAPKSCPRSVTVWWGLGQGQRSARRSSRVKWEKWEFPSRTGPPPLAPVPTTERGQGQCFPVGSILKYTVILLYTVKDAGFHNWACFMEVKLPNVLGLAGHCYF